MLNYNKLKQNTTGGGEFVNVQKLVFQTPWMMTWGASQCTKYETKEKIDKFELSLQFPTPDYPSPEGTAFLEKMKELESWIVEDAVKHSSEWFNKPNVTTEAVRDFMMNPMFKYPKIKGTKNCDYNKAPTLKVKIPHNNNFKNVTIYNEKGENLFSNTSGEPLPEIYDSSGEVITDKNLLPPIYLIPTYSKVISLIQLDTIWIVGGKMSIGFKLIQTVVRPPNSGFQNNVCHIHLPNNELTNEHTATTTTATTNSVEEPTLVEDDDEEEKPTLISVPIAEPAPAPAPAPVPVVAETTKPKKPLIKAKKTA